MDLSRQHLDVVRAVLRPVLRLAPRSYLVDFRADLRAAGLQRAVAVRDTPALFAWLVELIQLQGVSDAVAFGYSRQHGTPSWTDLEEALDGAACARLSSHWSFAECGFRKAARTCAEPTLLPTCPLPRLPARNGRLSQAVVSLFLFLRGVCDGDLVGWLDSRLAQAKPGLNLTGGAANPQPAVLVPLCEIYGVSRKVLSMALADLLLAGDPGRTQWVTAGASMIAVDSLVHNFLHRTGILHRLEAEHPYGERCYRAGGCAEIIEASAREIDAREFGVDFPAYFPRFVQSAIWRFCAAGELNVCNGNRIDDRDRCRNRFCPAFDACERISLRPSRSRTLMAEH